MGTRRVVWAALFGMALLGTHLTASPTLATPPAPPPSLPAPPQDVNVVNTPNVNVTNTTFGVSGTVNVGNLPYTQNVNIYRYAGISHDNTTGDAGGIGGMNDLCKDEFGLAAKMCNTKEYFSSVIYNSQAPYPPPEIAWIQPVIVAATYIGSHVLYVDYSGYIARSATSNDTFNCFQWTSTMGSSVGIALWPGTISGNYLGPRLCIHEAKVVCCVPDVQ